MNVSIVLSTYNGKTYLLEQLESLRVQTVQASEVLICDDCSTDETVLMIQEYIELHHLKNWHLKVNTKNKGWEKNFSELLFQTTGDFVFPCDQDDIWEERKVEIMCDYMEKHADIDLLCSDFYLLNMNGIGQRYRSRFSAQKSDSSLEKIENTDALWFVDRPGCTYCIRKNLIVLMEEIWFDKCPHDALAWRLAFSTSSLAVLHSPLIKFRRHETNATGARRNTLESRLEHALLFYKTLNRLESFCKSDTRCGKKQTQQLKKHRVIQEKRINWLTSLSIFEWITTLPYLMNFPSRRAYFADGMVILNARLKRLRSVVFKEPQ